jgi:signal transduction histidine kinase
MAGRILLLWMGSMLTLFPLLAQTGNEKEAYGVLTSTLSAGTGAKDSVLQFFKIADNYMDADRYDSAQLWLGKVGDRLELKKPGIFNFYYHSRQAEVFYYNNLLQIGQQQTNRALQIALQLKDSFFIADSYNFLGLFSLNLEKYREAEKYLISGLRHFPRNKKENYHLPLSESYHLHGNIGETYVKLGDYQKALLHFDSSVQQATLGNAPRALALGLISAGEALIELKDFDSAQACIVKGRQLAQQNRDNDVALLGFGNEVILHARMGDRENAYKLAAEGLYFLQVQQGMNPYYSLLFLRKLVDFYSLYHDYQGVSEVQHAIIETEGAVRRSNNFQLESVLSTGLNNENKLLQLEIEEARQKQNQNSLKIGFLLVIIALMLLGSLYYRNTLKQKLEMANMREKISRNLHDDIGASISSLHIYSTIAQSTLPENPSTTIELLQKISDQSKQLMENMNDMVWSMKGDEADGMTLGTRIKNYGAELLTPKNILCKYAVEEEAFNAYKNFESRKNILLIIKEAMNNLAKYSGATHASLELLRKGNRLSIKISDNGTGFDPSIKQQGNGLKNMEARTKELNGRFELITEPGRGTVVSVDLPIP